MNTDRLVDEMALAIIGICHMHERVCILALIMEGFRGRDIAEHLDEALALARKARADSADIANMRVQGHA